jgi:dihydroxy-acid dehydratase
MARQTKPKAAQLHSQQMRRQAPEIDSLKLGADWDVDDLSKPWILVESSYGKAMPCTMHLDRLREKAEEGVWVKGGAPAFHYFTDINDGIMQGTEAMRYSLLFRDLCSFGVEVHFRAGHFDAMVLIPGEDKDTPGDLVAAARLGDYPAILVPAGSMEPGPELGRGQGPMTLEKVGTIDSMLKRGEIGREEYEWLREVACPNFGTCAFMGTAETMQVMAEALGLALPTAACAPSSRRLILDLARQAGEWIVANVEGGLCTRDILTPEAFHNALVVHAAIAGSTNALLHLPVIAREAGVKLTLDDFDEVNRKAPWLTNVSPSGLHPTTFFWFAGGAQYVIQQLKDHLDLDCMTVTGSTLGVNLRGLEKGHFFERVRRYLVEYDLDVADVIRPPTKPMGREGSVAVLHGNLAPEGAVVKHSAVPRNMLRFTGRAKPVEGQDAALRAVFRGQVKPGDVLIIRYEGPRRGCPEQFYVTEAIASNRELNEGVALVTEGRFSGASRGPAIGHVSPEAMAGGPLAVVEEGDLISIDIPDRRIDVVGIGGREIGPAKASEVLSERRRRWAPMQWAAPPGILSMYAELATSAAEGGYFRRTFARLREEVTRAG